MNTKTTDNLLELKEIELCESLLKELNTEIATAEKKLFLSQQIIKIRSAYVYESLNNHHKLLPENFIKWNSNKKPQLQKLCLFAENLPISWGKIIKVSAADYEDRINELWGAGKHLSAKWNQKLAWLCALSNLGHYLWLKAWKPVSTVFRRLL